MKKILTEVLKVLAAAAFGLVLPAVLVLIHLSQPVVTKSVSTQKVVEIKAPYSITPSSEEGKKILNGRYDLVWVE